MLTNDIVSFEQPDPGLRHLPLILHLLDALLQYKTKLPNI